MTNAPKASKPGNVAEPRPSWLKMWEMPHAFQNATGWRNPAVEAEILPPVSVEITIRITDTRGTDARVIN